jgi:hypothetical protein
VLFCFVVLVNPACAQELTGTFTPQKHIYFLGEPLWFVFRVTNTGRSSLYIQDSKPYDDCAFMLGYSFELPGAKWTGPCGSYGGSCLGRGLKRLAPAETYAQRLLLNQWFVIDRAGTYHGLAKRVLSFSERSNIEGMLVAPRTALIRSEFEVTVVNGREADVEKALQPYVKNLTSRDFDRQTEAVETITAVAPPLLETKLIALATGKDSYAQSRAIPALGRLNTAAAKRTLARLVSDRQPYYSWQAIDALAQSGDRTYVPLLAELAREPEWQQLAIPALGELGGQEVIPVLLRFVRHPLGPPNEPPVQQLAIRGLANTRSREAIPYLIQELRNPLVHQDAVNALAWITHLGIHAADGKHWLYADDDGTAKQMAERWERWWRSTGEKATLYGPKDCMSSIAELPR